MKEEGGRGCGRGSGGGGTEGEGEGLSQLSGFEHGSEGMCFGVGSHSAFA